MPDLESPERIRALIALYRATHYDAAMPGGGIATLRIDAPVPATLRRWIGTGRCAGFITACNPHSQELSPAENRRRLEALRKHPLLQSCRVIEGIGHIPGQPWREPSLLVAGIDPTSIDRLAGEFAQNAVVVVTPAGIARLRLYRTDWRSVVGIDANLEWGSG